MKAKLHFSASTAIPAWAYRNKFLLLVFSNGRVYESTAPVPSWVQATLCRKGVSLGRFFNRTLKRKFEFREVGI